MEARFLVLLITLGATGAFAQSGMRPGIPPVHSTPPHGVGVRQGFGHRFFPAGFPLFLGDYDSSYSGYSPATNVVVVQQPPLYVMVPQAQADPPKAEIHEYQQPAVQQAEPASNEQQAFAIVLKDGSVHSAVAVTVQRNGLYYVEPDGRHQLISLDAVDRAATRRLNRERKLELQLPQ